MGPCKSHQQQIALFAVQGLSEGERALVLEHLRECAACRGYAKQLEGIVSLYLQDAERPIAPIPAAAAHCEVQPQPWFRWLFASPRAAMAALLALVTCGALLLMKHPPERELSPPTIASQAPAVPSIGNSRHLISADLAELTEVEPSRGSVKSEFVFSVRTRDDAGY